MDLGTPMTDEIVGRDRELLALYELLDSAASGRGSTALVVGEAGIGKSRLALAAAKRAASAGLTVVTGGCISVGDDPLRHVALIEILDRLDGGSPAVGRTTDEMLELMLRALRRATAAGPVVLIVEDLHWADHGTCQVVMALSRFIRTQPAFLFVTARDDELPSSDPRSRFLSELGRSELVTVFHLERFTRGQIVRHLDLLLGPGTSAETTEAIIERSGGNPLLIEELSAFEGQLPSEHRGLVDVLANRYRRLSPDARMAVAAFAAAEQNVGDEAIGRVTGMEPADVRAALDEAVEAHVLQLAGGSLDFRHAVLADAVRSDLLPDHRAQLHRAWATDFAETLPGDDPASMAVVSHHWLEGGDPLRALETAWQGAQIAEQVLAAELALSQYRRVIDLWDDVADASARVGTSYVEVVVHAAEVANRSGRPDTAVELTRGALDAADLDSATEAILHERVGWYLLRDGKVDEARDEYREAVDRADLSAPDDIRSRVVAGSVRIWERIGDHRRAVEVAQSALASALDSGSPVAIGQARYMLGHALMSGGDYQRAEEELLAAAESAEENRDPAALGWAHLAIASCAGRRGRLQDALDGVLASAKRLRDAGQADPMGAIASAVAGGLLLRLGQPARARKVGEEVLATTTSTIGTGLGHLIIGLCAVEALEIDTARRRLDLARSDVAPLYDGRLLGMLALGRVDLVLAEGTPELAAAIVRDATNRVANTGDDEMLVQLALAGLRAESVLARRTPGQASVTREERVRYLTSLVDRVSRAAQRPSHELDAALATVEACRQLLDGQTDPGAWERAALGWEAAQWPRLAVLSRIRQGEDLFRSGEVTTAAEALRAARVAASDLQSRFLAAEVDAAASRCDLDLDADA